MNQVALWIAMGATIAGCYFAACSAALRSFSRSKLSDLLKESGKSQKLEPFLERTSELVLITSTMRVGLNLVVLLCILSLFESVFEAGEQQLLKYVVSFAVAALVISVFAVAIPVSMARYQAERLLVRTMPLLNISVAVFRPLASLLYLFDPIVRRISGGQTSLSSSDELLTEEILSVVEDHEEDAAVDEDQKDMLEGVIELRSTTAGQIMTPRTDVKGIESDASLEQVKDAIITLGHSRIPVFHDNLDGIVGMLYAKDMIKFLGQNGQPFDLKQVIRDAFMVPESKAVGDLLGEFKARKIHIAVVLDEYGGTAGLVTIEDILEEIVGEIQDEYEPVKDNPSIRKLDDGVAEVDARVYVDDLNDEMRLKLPEDDGYDTVGGFVFSTLGHIPAVDESFEFDNIRITVTDAERTRVNRVRVEVLAASSGDDGNGR